MRYSHTFFLSVIICAASLISVARATFPSRESSQPFLGEVIEIEEHTGAFRQAQTELYPQHTRIPSITIGTMNERINQANSELNRFIITPEELQYTGVWSAPNQSNIDWFEFPYGSAQFDVRQDLKVIHVRLNGGKYYDQKAVKLEIAYTARDFNSHNGTFANERASMTVNYLHEYASVKKNDSCTANYSVKFFNTTNGKPAVGQADQFINVSLVLHSSDCNFIIQGMFTDNDKKALFNAMLYAIFVTGLCCLHICACIQFIKYIGNNPTEATKYSLTTVGFFMCWDIVLGFFHLYNSMLNPQYFQFFIMPALWYLVLSTIFEARVLMCLWGTRNVLENRTLEETRTHIFTFYLRFYGSLIFLLVMAHYFLYKNWCLLASGLFFIPQIVRNASEGHHFPKDYIYVLGLGLSRILIPLYVRGYSENVFMLTPDPSFCAWYVTLCLAQVAVLFLQAKLGSRFFVPRCLLPKPFDYYLKAPLISRNVNEEEEACPICIQSYSDAPEGSDLKAHRLMQTPCRHVFHEHCLKKWMCVKLECPFCKTPIPPYI